MVQADVCIMAAYRWVASHTASLSCMQSETFPKRRPRILLGATGSVAAIKVAELARHLAAVAEVRIIATDAAKHFIDEAQLPHQCRPLLGKDRRRCSSS